MNIREINLESSLPLVASLDRTNRPAAPFGPSPEESASQAVPSVYNNDVILEQSKHAPHYIQLSGLLAIAIQSDSAVLGETEIVTADHFSQDPRIANVKYRALSIGPLASALLYLFL